MDEVLTEEERDELKIAIEIRREVLRQVIRGAKLGDLVGTCRQRMLSLDSLEMKMSL